VSLGWKVVFQSAAVLFAFGAALFVTAGTLRYWEAWVFLGVWFVPGVFGFYYSISTTRSWCEGECSRRSRSRNKEPS
jgi:hypothetical protein